MFHGHGVDILVSPHPLLVVHQPVLEQAQALVGPDPYQRLHREGLVGLQGLVDASYPAGHLTGTVDVVRLHVLSESVLGGGGKATKLKCAAIDNFDYDNGIYEI